MAERRPFCAELSRENDEPLGATASQIDHWLLIEYRGVWARDAVSGSGLSDQVKEHLRAQVAATPGGRLLFVRRPDRRRTKTLLAYAADSRPGREELRRVEVEWHEDLRELDLVDRSTGTQVDHPLFLVCTHGKHDRCCARFGRPLYEALRDEVDPEWVWQTTHIGGDRFAGNLVCLPEGIYYGRAGRLEAGQILDEHLAGRLHLEHYRGRSTYAFAVQAAERALREAHGLLGIDDLTLESAERDGETWEVVFAARGERHPLRVDAEPGDLTYLTCNAPAAQRPRRYVVTRR